ncbi:MAG: molecular chaperone DnaK, partial [Acidobacteriota bacterium]
PGERARIAVGQAVEEALDSARKARDEGSLEGINTAIDKLTSSSHKLAEVMYKSAQGGAAGPGPDASAGAGAPPPPGGDAKKDEVVDAEFVDVDDKGKK